MTKTTKIYPIKPNLPRPAQHEIGQKQLYKVDLQDGTYPTYTTLARHDKRFRTHTLSYYVKVNTGQRIPAHVVVKWLDLGYLTPARTSPARPSKQAECLAAA